MKKLKTANQQNKNIDVVDHPHLKKSHLGWVIVSALSLSMAVGVTVQMEQPVNTENVVEAANIATGKWGTVSWNIDSAGVLHLGAGTGTALTTVTSTVTNPIINNKTYAVQVLKISIDGDIILPSSIQGMFAYLTKATSITGVEHLKMSTVTDASYMFNNMESITTLNLNNLDVSTVTNFKNILSDLDSITYIDISSWSTSKATDMTDMFLRNNMPAGTKPAGFNKIKFGYNFVTPKTSYPSIGNAKPPLRWRAVGTGSETNPLGNYLDEGNTGSTTYITEPVMADTYVLTKYDATLVHFWTPQGTVDTTMNTGLYGDGILTGYVSSIAPFSPQGDTADVLTVSKTEVQAKGIWGPTVSNGVKWYIKDNILHLSNGLGADIAGASPWLKYASLIKKVQLDCYLI